MSAEIPFEIESFVAKHISSLDQLEILLLVSALPDRHWSAEAVYKVILSNQATVAQQLEVFVAVGIFMKSGDPPTYCYAPTTDALARQVAALSSLYKTSRHKFVELIYRPVDPAKSFSDAFKFKQDK